LNVVTRTPVVLAPAPTLGVVASAIVVGLGAKIADPIIGFVMTLVILKITWISWRTVRAATIDPDYVEEH
jgi:divalent metal cation (Fe/Co/Zn/Cd) transporter